MTFASVFCWLLCGGGRSQQTHASCPRARQSQLPLSYTQFCLARPAEMLLLCLLLVPGLCVSSGILQQVALLHSVAVLSCPHAGGDVTWSRVRNGAVLVLVTVTEGQETRRDRRFGSQADGSLVITNTEASDETVYFCNDQHRVYLKVTSDPKEVPSKAPPEPGPQSSNGKDGGDLTGGSAGIWDASGWWKVPVGAVSGASVVLLGIFILRFCSAKRTGTGATDCSGPEVVYEEIQVCSSPEVPGPPCWPHPAGLNPFSTAEHPQAGDLTRIHHLAPDPEETRTKENEIYCSDG